MSHYWAKAEMKKKNHKRVLSIITSFYKPMGINHLCRCRDYKIRRIVKQSSLGDTFLVSHTLYLTLGSIYRVHTSLSHHLCQADEYWISAHIYCVYCLLIYLLILYRRRGTSSFWTHLKVVQPPTACHTIIQHQPGSIPASGQPPPPQNPFPKWSQKRCDGWGRFAPVPLSVCWSWSQTG